jgi:hypothetical protein
MAARRRHATHNDLSSIQFSKEGIGKLQKITQRTGESYEQYIRRRLRL